VQSDLPDLAESVSFAERQNRKFQRELSAGLTSLVLLAILDRASDDLYGYEIGRRLAGEQEGAGPFKLGALYPVLRNLSAAGLLTSRVVPSYAGPARRYYRITPLGREALTHWRATWAATRDFVDSRVAEAAPAGAAPAVLPPVSAAPASAAPADAIPADSAPADAAQETSP
jgi:PadR family transcriptional regulator PadR